MPVSILEMLRLSVVIRMPFFNFPYGSVRLVVCEVSFPYIQSGTMLGLITLPAEAHALACGFVGSFA